MPGTPGPGGPGPAGPGPAGPGPAGLPPGQAPAYGTAAYGATPYGTPPYGPGQAGPSDSRGWVIAAFILFWPLGIAALFPSLRASRAIGAGDLATAAAEADTARKRSIVAIIVAVALFALSTILSFIMFAALVAQMDRIGDDLLPDDYYSPVPEGTTQGEADRGTEPSAPAVVGDPVGLEQLALGDCLTGASQWAAVPETVGRVACDQPHSGEVYASFPVDTAQHPDDEALSSAVDGQCLAEFGAFVGVDYLVSELQYWYGPGTVEGDTVTVHCIVSTWEGDVVTGTLRGAAR